MNRPRFRETDDDVDATIEKVLFCKECVISNQRPSSAIEFKHKKNEIKSTINFILYNKTCTYPRLHKTLIIQLPNAVFLV